MVSEEQRTFLSGYRTLPLRFQAQGSDGESM